MALHGHNYGNSLIPDVLNQEFGDDAGNNHASYHIDTGEFDGHQSEGTYSYDPADVKIQSRQQVHHQQHQALQPQEHFRYYQGKDHQLPQDTIFGTNTFFGNNLLAYRPQNTTYHNREQHSQAAMMYNDFGFDIPSVQLTPEQRAPRIYTGQPYAKLIHKALLSAPGHRMVLRDIYRWFELNTDKTTKGGKGWQNSIRHNLSMNAAFIKEETRHDADDGKRSNVWKLDPQATDANNLLSTTRFRKPISKKTPVFMHNYRVSKPSCEQSMGFNMLNQRHIGNNTFHTEINSPQIKQEPPSLDTIRQERYPSWAMTNYNYPVQSPSVSGLLYTPSNIDYGYQTELSTPAFPSRQNTVPSEDFSLPFWTQQAALKPASPAPSMTNTSSSYNGNEPADLVALPINETWTNAPPMTESFEQQGRRESSTQLYNSLYNHGNIVNSVETI